ncbi:MAG: AMP-binding protein, partial [Bacilli bacterium]
LSSVFLNVIAPIDKEITSIDLSNLIEKFDIKVLFYTNKTKDIVLSAIKDNSALKLINLDECYQYIIQKEYPAKKFLDEVKFVDKDKFSVLAFTSGTTGEFKGVMLSQYNITSNLRAAIENNPLKSPTLVVLPMNHTYGFNPGVLNTLYNSGTLCINMDLKYIVKDLKIYNPYFVGVVPMMVEGIYNNIIREAKRKNKYNMLMKMIKISNFLLKFKIDIRHLLFGNILCKGLRLMVSGGATLNPIYVEKFEELGIKLLNGYGLTECSPLVAVNRDIYNVPGSVGTIIKDDDVIIAKDGEILVKGPNVMLGYYKDKKSTRESMKNGYFKTGDFGYKKGNILYITGRKKNLIILENGKNFSPEVIEEKLLELPYIKECIVTTRKRKNNTIIVAKLYIDGEKSSIEKDIERINTIFPKYMHIDDYEIMDTEFEKNSTKKIIRSKYVR